MDIDTILYPTLTENGGQTLTHALQTGSQDINAGNQSYSGSLTTDQRGEDRLAKGRVDIGAFEQQGLED